MLNFYSSRKQSYYLSEKMTEFIATIAPKEIKAEFVRTVNLQTECVESCNFSVKPIRVNDALFEPKELPSRILIHSNPLPIIDLYMW